MWFFSKNFRSQSDGQFINSKSNRFFQTILDYLCRGFHFMHLLVSKLSGISLVRIHFFLHNKFVYWLPSTNDRWKEISSDDHGNEDCVGGNVFLNKLIVNTKTTTTIARFLKLFQSAQYGYHCSTEFLGQKVRTNINIPCFFYSG